MTSISEMEVLVFKDYFFHDNFTAEEIVERHKRLRAVQAAYEFAVASVSAGSTDAGVNKLKFDLQHASEHIAELADAIQEALEN